MTSQRSAKQFRTVQSSDPNHVPETYANTVTQISIRHNNAHITLGVVRPSQKPGLDENVVASRVVMPIETLEQLLRAYGHMKAADTQKPGGTVN